VNFNVKILDRRSYSQSLKDVAWLENAQLDCSQSTLTVKKKIRISTTIPQSAQKRWLT